MKRLDPNSKLTVSEDIANIKDKWFESIKSGGKDTIADMLDLEIREFLTDDDIKVSFDLANQHRIRTIDHLLASRFYPKLVDKH